jgi:hypothetical protein
MNHKISTHLLEFVILILLVSQTGSVAASPKQAASDWKLPLPSGTYVITQGDQDSCTSTHCRSSGLGEWVYCSIDLWSSNIDGLPILAPAAGKVLAIATENGGAGLHMTIQHDDGFVSQYQHLQVVYVQKNDRVIQGQPIARADSSGKATGAHLHFGVFTDSSYNQCVKIVSLDGNTDFRTSAKVISSNTQVGNIPGEGPSPIPPAPPVTSSAVSSGGPDPWDVSWLPRDQQQVIAAINAIITSPDTGGSPNAGLKGYGETILNYALASIEQNPAGVNPAFALAMFRKEANFATNGAAAANNNPGNIICAGGTRPLYGAIRCNGRFGVYASMGDGIKAYFWLLQAEYKPGGAISRNCPDISCIIRAYAPSSDGNNTQQYIDQVTAWTKDFQNRIANGMQPPSPGAPDKPMLANPGNGSSMAQSTDVTLHWSSANNATQYKVELWGGPYSTMTPCDWQSGTSCQIGAMYPGVMQWHVKARNSSGQESGWSDTWTFTIQGPTETPPTKTPTPPPQAPGAPTLRGPSNGSSYPQSQDIWFAWNYVSNADRYYLEYWGGPYGTLNSGWINDVAYHSGTMWPGTYKWHVKSRGQNGVESNWSDTWSFTIQDTPQSTNTPVPPTAPPSAGRPTLSRPDNGSSWPQSADITLVWNAASNATRYKVELWGGPYSTMIPCDWQSGTSCHIGQMWPGTMSWHVKARNSNGQETDWSDTWSFTIQDIPKPPTDTPRPSFTGNIAPRANRSPDGSGSGNAFDGNLSTFWTDGLGHGFTLTLSLPGSFDVSRILVWDRPQNSPDNQQINRLIISLSNGWSKRFDMNSGGPRCIDVTLSSPQTITSVTLQANDASGNNGLSEVEIWVGSKTGGPTCSNSGSMP